MPRALKCGALRHPVVALASPRRDDEAFFRHFSFRKVNPVRLFFPPLSSDDPHRLDTDDTCGSGRSLNGLARQVPVNAVRGRCRHNALPLLGHDHHILALKICGDAVGLTNNCGADLTPAERMRYADSPAVTGNSLAEGVGRWAVQAAVSRAGDCCRRWVGGDAGSERVIFNECYRHCRSAVERRRGERPPPVNSRPTTLNCANIRFSHFIPSRRDVWWSALSRRGTVTFLQIPRGQPVGVILPPEFR